MSNQSSLSKTSLLLLLGLIIGAVVGYQYSTSTFQKKVNSYESQISEISNQINSHTSTILNLEKKNEEYENVVTELIVEVNTKNFTIITLEQENKRYTSQIESLENNVSYYQSHILDLNTIIAEYEEGSSQSVLEHECEYNVTILENKEYYYSMIEDLRNAERSIIVRMYSMIYDSDDTFDWANDLIEELVYAKNRGVSVLVILEYRTYFGRQDDNLDTYTYLNGHGVEVILDNENDTDHVKSVIIDEFISYIGSHNWTESGLYHNNEVSVKLIMSGNNFST